MYKFKMGNWVKLEYKGKTLVGFIIQTPRDRKDGKYGVRVRIVHTASYTDKLIPRGEDKLRYAKPVDEWRYNAVNTFPAPRK